MFMLQTLGLEHSNRSICWHYDAHDPKLQTLQVQGWQHHIMWSTTLSRGVGPFFSANFSTDSRAAWASGWTSTSCMQCKNLRGWSFSENIKGPRHNPHLLRPHRPAPFPVQMQQLLGTYLALPKSARPRLALPETAIRRIRL